MTEPLIGQCSRCGGNLAMCLQRGCPSEARKPPQKKRWRMVLPPLHEFQSTSSVRAELEALRDRANDELTKREEALEASELCNEALIGVINLLRDRVKKLEDLILQ